MLTSWIADCVYPPLPRASSPTPGTITVPAALADSMSDCVVGVDADGLIVHWNRAAERTYRRPAADVMGQPVAEALGTAIDLSGLAEKGLFSYTDLHRASDGTAVPVHVAAAPAETGAVLVCTDLRRPQANEQRLQTVVERLDEGIVLLSPDGDLVSINPAALRILGMKPGQLATDFQARASQVPLFDASGEPLAREKRPNLRVQETGTAIMDTVYGVDWPDGQRRWLCISYQALHPEDPAGSDILVTLRDVTARHEATLALTHQANHDALTGLPNRACVISTINAALQPDAEKVLGAVLFIDIDDLKAVNDALGHGAGDDLLRQAGRRLKAAVEGYGMVGRVGGDEFVVVIERSLRPGEIDDICRSLAAALDGPVAIAGATAPRIRASVGVACVDPAATRSAEELLSDADRAMYRAKAEKSASRVRRRTAS
ncbi:diguanylate cyclase domain-containing protein [Mycobacterium parmense]|uniref:Uncharacterized protein n=1 Tax=Mycobacterium parmense TaxID=185642 RepID=A0A7I7YXZ8_9MYCO|nr:diguanylate cyclase [Mycobacterium parmense]MCV7353583.1 diguanylate cyclase [Mycobacterium parmense]ORW62696.1 hypothetical protein AWC20_05145 [Mycobacterium parmense]BBZ46232.1 hypothetical protein MPRM_35130 [Mycobacterium parmense]